MPTEQEVQGIVTTIQQRLSDAQRRGIHLQISGNKLEDDWLYVVITPSKPGERASDHARLMSEIERELRQSGTNQVLLVPAIDD
jgi:hypothetical protein